MYTVDEMRKPVLIIYSFSYLSLLNIQFLRIMKGSACGLWSIGESVSAVSSSACSEGNLGWGKESVSLDSLVFFESYCKYFILNSYLDFKS